MEAATSEPVSWDLPLALAVGLFFVGLTSLVPVPAQIAPYSLLTFVPAFLAASVIGESGLVMGAFLGSLIAPLTFLLLVRHMQKTGNLVPRASVVTFAVLAALSVLCAGIGWSSTVRFTSAVRATALVAQAVLPALLLAIAGVTMRNHLTFRRSLVLHWFGFAWLAWSAFPWYGELL